MPNHTRYVLYQITDLRSGKYYVGAHACADDHPCFANGMCTYMGSGTALTSAIQTYGRESFKKDILAEVSSAQCLSELEAAIVDEPFVAHRHKQRQPVGGARRAKPSVTKGTKRSHASKRTP